MSTKFQPGARAWLRAAMFVGLGQQVFVVLRNQYLLDLGLAPEAVTVVQGAGGAAGIVAGLVGLWALRRFRARTLLLAGVVANAAGFAIQVSATTAPTMVAGAAVAGLGIQGLTMTAAPFLAAQSTPSERVRLFAAQTLVIQTVPGVVGALLAGGVYHVAGGALASPLGGYRVALGVGLASSVVGLVPLLGLPAEHDPAPTGARTLLRLHQPARAVALLTPDVLVFFGNGLVVPFLQIYFKQRFGLVPSAIGGLYAVLMLAGSLGHVLSPRLAARFGTWRVILATQLASLPLFAELLVAGHVPLAATAFVLRQAVMNMSAPLYVSLLHSSVAPEDSGPVASYRMLAQSVAWAGASFLAGPLIAADRGDFRYVLAATMVAYVAAIATGALVFPRASRWHAARSMETA